MTWALALAIGGAIWLVSAVQNRSVRDVLRNAVGASTDEGPGPRGFNTDLLASLATGGTTSTGGSKRAKLSGGAGVGSFDGKPVAECLIPILKEARKRGWKGSVTSGYRSAADQARVCAQTSGPCAAPGESNHQNKDCNGAVDVSDYGKFGQIMAQMGNPLKNSLGASDPVHFSKSGN